MELTPELVFAALRKHGVSYRLAELRAEGCALYREETFHPSYAFSPRDFVVGDLRDAPQWLTEREDGGNVPMLELRPKLMWKNVNKAEQVLTRGKGVAYRVRARGLETGGVGMVAAENSLSEGRGVVSISNRVFEVGETGCWQVVGRMGAVVWS